jgi:hypothetical protein
MGLNGRVGKIGDHLQILTFEKESEERGKREFLDGREKRTPSLLNLAPTSQYGKPWGGIENYAWKAVTSWR